MNGTESPTACSDFLSLNEVTDLLVLARRRGNPEEIAYFEELHKRKEQGEQIPRPSAIWPGQYLEIDGENLFDQVKTLMDAGANCPEQIMADTGQLQQWVIVQCGDPNIKARLESVKDLKKLDTRINSLIRQNTKGTTVLEHGEIAEYLKDRFSTVSFNKTIYIYDGGIYRPNAGDLEERIREIITRSNAKCSITKDTRDILAYVSTYNRFLEFPFNRCKDTIPVRNGVVKVDYPTGTSALLPHSPEHMLTFKLSARYDPTVSADIALDLLKGWVEPEDIPLLIQIPAQAILQAQLLVTYKKAYIAQGEPHAGKSTYIDFLTWFFGPGLISNKSLQALCKDRFVASGLEGKMLNVYDDLREIPLENVGTFKTYTGSCHHDIERKFQQSYKGIITCPHLFSCNRPPRYTDDVKYDAAFWERWEYVRFPFFYEVDDSFMAQICTDEMSSSFLNLIIQSMITIRKNHRLSVNRDAAEVMERWSTAADPLYQFIREKMTENARPSDITAFDRKKLFDQYREYCEAEGIDHRKRISTLSKFTRDIQGYKLTPGHTTRRIEGKKHDILVYNGPYRWNGERKDVEPGIDGLTGGTL